MTDQPKSCPFRAAVPEDVSIAWSNCQREECQLWIYVEKGDGRFEMCAFEAMIFQADKPHLKGIR